MKLNIKYFNELTKKELYAILKLRVDVFVVEQACPYPELDNLDQDAVHVFYKDGDEILAYLRIMDRGVESDYVSIGRVISSKRLEGLGTSLMKEGIKAAREIFDAEKIYLEAQTYVRKFYENLGFKKVSDEFFMDDIPHIKMELDLDEARLVNLKDYYTLEDFKTDIETNREFDFSYKGCNYSLTYVSEGYIFTDIKNEVDCEYEVFPSYEDLLDSVRIDGYTIEEIITGGLYEDLTIY